MANLTAVNQATGGVLVKDGESVVYTIGGSFTGSVALQACDTPAAGFKTVETKTTTGIFPYTHSGDPKYYYVTCTAIGAEETITASLEVINQASTVAPLNTKSIGEAASSGIVAREYGDASTHTTILTIRKEDGFTALGDNANKAVGCKLYTFPAGVIQVLGSSMSIGATAASTEIQADTPDLGLGTTIASGAVATLDGTAAFENILTGQTMADMNGTASVKSVATNLVIETGDSHDVYLNVADGWANDTGGDLTADVSGTVVLRWAKLG